MLGKTEELTFTSITAHACHVQYKTMFIHYTLINDYFIYNLFRDHVKWDPAQLKEAEDVVRMNSTDKLTQDQQGT